MQILAIQKGFEAFEFKFKTFERDLNADSNYSNRIQRIQM